MLDTTPPAIDRPRVDSYWIDRKRVEIDREPVDRCEIDRDPVDRSGGYVQLTPDCVVVRSSGICVAKGTH